MKTQKCFQQGFILNKFPKIIKSIIVGSTTRSQLRFRFYGYSFSDSRMYSSNSSHLDRPILHKKQSRSHQEQVIRVIQVILLVFPLIQGLCFHALLFVRKSEQVTD
ncbi:hypothetical protein NL108_011294 [Boleophthalmus pectinirostris]|nr:hypothetical protein NL108_011294 [Boleophthalmus pectinirostris]